MLVLSRKKGERILVGEVVLTVVEIRGDKVRLGIEADRNIPIQRPDAKKKNDPLSLQQIGHPAIFHPGSMPAVAELS